MLERINQHLIIYGARASSTTPRALILMAIVGTMLLLTACIALPEGSAGEDPETPAMADSTQEVLIASATADLAEQLNVNADEIEVDSIEAVEWGDSSLGCPEEGMMYAAVITPGYRITLSHDGDEYVYHTGAEADGPVINCSDNADPTSPDANEEPAAGSTDAQLVLLVKEELAASLNVDADSIDVKSIESVEWGDSSLGCPQDDMMYAQVITPGYRITLTHDGVDYVYHTGADADTPVINCTDSETAVAPAGDTEESAPMLTTSETLVARAIADLAKREGIVPSAIDVKSAQAVEWRDGSLGCAQAGMMYPQVITPGYRITLTIDGIDYAYHTGGQKDGPIKYCKHSGKMGDDGAYRKE